MKKYVVFNEDDKNMIDTVYYVGTIADCKSLYKALRRASHKGNADVWEMFLDRFPKFDERKRYYAVGINCDGMVYISTSDCILSGIVEGWLVKA